MSKPILPFVSRIARRWDRLRQSTKIQIGMTGTPLIVGYRGYRADEHAVFGGRVIEDEGVIGAPSTHSRWKNLWQTFRRYETDEIRKATVTWRVAGQKGSVETGAQGFFRIDAPIADAPDSQAWASVDLELEAAPGYDFEPIKAICNVRIVAPEAAFGVISDIDDTIIQTGAQDLLKHWRTVSLNSAEGRVAFPGVGRFFRALASGAQGAEANPIFYVSSSPWNLYDLFEDFLELCDIPKGPMFLKDFGIDKTQWLSGSHREHKLGAIDRIMNAYPDLSFVLIGDTGQSDAAIYREAVETYPGRILAVHLRDVTPKGFKPRVRRAIAAIERASVPITSGPSLQEAATVAEDMGLVAQGTSEALRAEIKLDRERLSDWSGPMPFRKIVTRGGLGKS